MRTDWAIIWLSGLADGEIELAAGGVPAAWRLAVFQEFAREGSRDVY